MEGLIKPLLYDPGKHIYRLVREKNYRTLCWMASRFTFRNRRSPGKTRLHSWTVHFPDALSLLFTYRDIFVNGLYAFPAADNRPHIVDAGANIGLSALFFKQLYPECRITALEPDPAVFSYLEKNMRGNGYTDVRLINSAAWVSDTQLSFHPEGADAGYLTDRSGNGTITVEAIDLAQLLRDERVDFLKLDIEGAESVVVPGCSDAFERIPFVFVEYHSRIGEKQSIDSIVSVLSRAGYRLHMQPVFYSPAPFRTRRTQFGFDLQVNIFAWKEIPRS